MNFDRIILGGGIYGLYSAIFSARNNKSILVLEYEEKTFGRATSINQSRLHMGYHYPRSISTALKSAQYFDRFYCDFKDAINDSFTKIYGISSSFSWTNSYQFEKFCNCSNIPCNQINTEKYFKKELCEGVFITKEYTVDFNILHSIFKQKIKELPQIKIINGAKLKQIKKLKDKYEIILESGEVFSSDFVINTTYASINQIHEKSGFAPFDIKYELCEIILVKTEDNLLKNTGITLMDGPFFSIIPFGKSNFHALTSVSFTPHKVSFEKLPTFECQKNIADYCNPLQLGNCNNCINKPATAWPYMRKLAHKYLKNNLKFEYYDSIFAVKPVLKSSEIDDSRPTLIKYLSQKPYFLSVLSGKINTIYDLELRLK
ncbi:MAG: NAD(P)-binding protein [Candidatus Muiribacteriota bacterium]